MQQCEHCHSPLSPSEPLTVQPLSSQPPSMQIVPPAYDPVEWSRNSAHSPTAAVATPLPTAFRTVTMPQDWVMPAEQLYATATATVKPLWVPPPPVLARPSWSRWWQGMGVLLPIFAYFIMRNSTSWGNGIGLISRLCFATACLIAIWLMATQLPNWYWPQQRHPIAMVSILFMCGVFCTAITGPATYLQGQQAEQRADYATAYYYYQQSGNAADRTRVQIAWGQALTDSNNQFALALPHLQTALASSNGIMHEEARTALGHLYWRWGQAQMAAHNIAGARQQWQTAQQQAEGTVDGDHAIAALNAPQTVTGHITWKNVPLPGTQVSLVSGWKYSSSLRLLQTEGDRFTAISGEDGSFSISGVKPGVRYALIWQGNFGDTTTINAFGEPAYTVTVQTLEGSSIGMIAVDINSAN